MNSRTISSAYRSLSGIHMNYAGIDFDGTNIIRNTDFTRDILLTYNANPSRTGPNETGYVMNYQGGPALSRSAAADAAQSLPQSYPIGWGDLQAARDTESRGIPPKVLGKK
jgi:hypothetical protein